jgi:hypothetical protein
MVKTPACHAGDEGIVTPAGRQIHRDVQVNQGNVAISAALDNFIRTAKSAVTPVIHSI